MQDNQTNDLVRIEESIISYIVSTHDLQVLIEVKPEYFTSVERERAIKFLIDNPDAGHLEVKVASKLGLSSMMWTDVWSEGEAMRLVSLLKEQYIRNRLASIEVNPDNDVTETINSLQTQLEELTQQTENPSGSMSEARKQAEELAKDKVRYRFDLPTLDGAMQFRRGGLYVIGGRPGSGKSYLALQFALIQALQSIPTLFISTELTSGANFIRLQNLYMGMDGTVPSETAADILTELNTLLIHDTLVSIDSIVHEVRKQTARSSIQVVVIDHIQEVGNDKHEDDLQKIEDMLTQLRLLAMNKNLCIVLASQLNKEGSFKGASKIQEVSAGSIVVTKDNDILSLEVTKNRNGERPKDPILCKQEWPSGLFMETRGQQTINEFKSI